MKLLNSFKKKLTVKLVFFSSALFVVSFIFLGWLVSHSFNRIKEESLDVIDESLSDITSEYYTNYLDSIQLNASNSLDYIYNELFIMADIARTVVTNKDEFTELNDYLDATDYFNDDFTYNGRWGQNVDDEPTSLLLAGFLYDEDGNLVDEAEEIRKSTILFDLFMPSFYKYGANKVQVFYQGPSGYEVFRMSPWTDLGTSVFDSYTIMNEQPTWELFNPGLYDYWQNVVTETKGLNIDQKSITKATPPVFDYVTDEMIITLSFPLYDEETYDMYGGVSFDIRISEIINSIEEIQVAETGFSFITQEDGTIFALNKTGQEILGFDEQTSDDPEGSGYRKATSKLSDSKYESIQNITISSTDIVNFQDIEINGVDYYLISKGMYSFTQWTVEQGFYPSNWSISFMIPKAEVNALHINAEETINRESTDTISMLLTIGVFTLVLLLSISSLLINRSMIQIKLIMDAIDKFKRGKFDVTIESHTEDELGEISDSFNQMSGLVRSTIRHLQDQNKRLNQEVKERESRDKMINYLEKFDQLTKLPNKATLFNMIDERINVTKQPFSLVVLGIDDFREINNAYSWVVGDLLLVKLTERLENNPHTSHIFKLAGDEFALIFDSEDIEEIMDEVIDIQKDLIKVYQIRENAIQVSISIGISNYPIDTVKTNDLFKFASSAMNHTKRENKGSYEFYAPELHDSTRHKLELLNKLKNALENDEFFLEYQKIIDPYSETIAGYESLIRWQSEGKIIPPNDFIPLAEKSLEINSIGCWVIEESIKALIKLQINNPETFISINLSPVQFKSNDLVLFIEEKIREYDINPSKLHFEITESLFIEDFEQVQEKLMAITDLGCTIALDDFGTGFSSLSYLQRLPISIIKIDRSFVLGIDHPTNRKIIDSIIALGNSLGMIIIAEGIETDEHLKYLKDRNCELIQGYYYSKPLKLNETLKEV